MVNGQIGQVAPPPPPPPQNILTSYSAANVYTVMPVIFAVFAYVLHFTLNSSSFMTLNMRVVAIVIH